MNILTIDHAAAQDSVTQRAVDVTARQAVLEAAALLRALGHWEQSEKLLKYSPNIERRTKQRAALAIERRPA